MSIFDAPSENLPETDPEDFSDPRNALRANAWTRAKPSERPAIVPRAMAAVYNALEADKTIKVPYHNAEGEVIMASAWLPNNTLSTAGQQHLDKSLKVFSAAAQDENGGLDTDLETGDTKSSASMNYLFSQKHEDALDILPDFDTWSKEQDADLSEDGSSVGTWESYVDHANADTKTGEAEIDVDDKRLRAEWAKRNKMRVFDPNSLGDNVTGFVGNDMVLNPNTLEQVGAIEASIEASDKSDYEKKRFLDSYKKKVDAAAGEIVNAFSATDAGVIGSIGIGDYLKDKVGLDGDSTLRDDFMKAAESPNFSFYDFLKENQDRMDKDENGIGTEIAAKFRDALMATGTGALFLVGKGVHLAAGDNAATDLLSAPAEAYGGLAEDTAAGYNNQVAFSVGDIDINRRDLTELTGQVGSFFAMGGLGKLAVGGAVKAGIMKAPEVATKVAAKTMGAKALGQVKAVFTDPTAYAGGVQAAGMGFGRTFDQVMRSTGDRDQAYKEASIDGLSDGLSALIATGVMNRFGMGAEAAFGGKATREGAEGIIQNIRSRMTGRAGMKGTQTMLNDFVENPVLRKQIAKDLMSQMNKSAKEKGLRGLGIVGGTASEAVEESMDEVLSDVFKAIQDDSKTWNEEVWQNIGTKWKDYVKAGILGAIGGAGGEGVSSAFSPTKTFGKSEANQDFNADWDMIKSNIPEFSDPNNVMKGANGDAKSMAEYIAWSEEDGGPDIKTKSAALIQKARFGNTQAMGSALQTIKEAPTQEPVSPDTPPVEDSEGRYSDDEAGGVLQKLGLTPPEGQEWNEDVVLSPDKKGQEFSYTEKEKKTSITSLSIANGSRGVVPDVAAKVTVTEKGEDPITTTITAAEAHQLLSEAKPTGFLSSKRNVDSGLKRFADHESNLAQAKESSDSMLSPIEEAETISPLEGTPEVSLPEDKQPAEGPTPEAGEPVVSPTKAEPIKEDEPTEQSPPDPIPPTEITAESTQALGDGEQRGSSGGDRGVSVDGEAVTGERKEADSTPEVESFKKVVGKFYGKKVKLEQAPTEGGYNSSKGIHWNKDSVIVTDEAFDLAISEADGPINAKKLLQKRINAVRKNQSKSKLGALPSTGESPALSEETINNLNEESSYVVNRSDLDSKEPSVEGQWKKEEDKFERKISTATYYTLTPPKGQSLKTAIGDIITVSGGKDSVLVLEAIEDGKYIFREDSIADLNEAMSFGLDHKGVSKYTRSTLQEASQLFLDHLGSIQGGGSLSAATMEKLFNKVMAVVSPTTSFKVVSKKISDEEGKFIYADPNGEGSIVVDFDRLAAQFKSQYQNSNSSSELGNKLLALDAARQMGSTIDEEITHILAFREFEDFEIEDFIGEILDEMEAGTKHPYLDLFKSTVKERLNITDEAAMQDIGIVDRYIVGAELIRKLNQLGNSGFTTEMASLQSRYLQAAIAGDEKANLSKDAPSFLRTIGEMVRRYADRIRRILWAKFQQGRISDTQRDVLVRLNRVYRDAGVKADFDLAHQAATEQVKFREELFEKSFEDSVSQTARRHSVVTAKLREFGKSYPNGSFYDVFSVNPETMTLGLSSEMRAIIEKDGSVDMDNLDSYLADMNAEGDRGMPNSSYHMAMTSAFLKQQKMSLLRDQVVGDFDENQLQLGLVDRGTKGFLSNSDLWANVVDSAPENVSSEELLATFNQAKLEQVEILKKEEASTAFAKGAFLNQAQKDLTELKGKTDVKSINSLMNWTKTLRTSSAPIGNPWVNFDELSSTQEKADFLEGKRLELMVRLSLPTPNITNNLSFASQNEANELLTKFQEQEVNEVNVRNELQQSNKLIQDQINSKESGKPERRRLTEDEFNRFVEFIQAVDDYNTSIKSVIERALGNFGTNNKGFGLSFINLNSPTGEVTDQIEPVDGTKGSDVLAAPLIRSHVHQLRDRTSEEITYTSPYERGARIEGEFRNAPLTPAQIEKNAFISEFRTAVESNNRFAARTMYSDYWIAKNTFKIQDLASQEEYEGTGGFKLKSVTDPETGITTYENAASAFPLFDNQLFYGLRGSMRDLASPDVKRDKNLDVFNEIMEHIQEARQWSTLVRSKFEGGVTEEIGGSQTIAARWKVILDDVFSGPGEFDNELSQFEHDLKSLYEGRVKRGKDGRYELIEGVSAKDAAKFIGERLSGDKGTLLDDFQISMRETKKVVDLTREALRVLSGQDRTSREWRNNVEKEGSTVMRDPTYVPDNTRMNRLRDFNSDPRVLAKMRWVINYMAKPNDYNFSPNWGFEAEDEFNALQRGSAREAFVYTEKVSEVEWLNDEQIRDYEADPANVANVSGESKILTDPESGRLFYVTNWRANFNDVVVTANEARFDDFRNKPMLTGETTPLLEDFNEDFSVRQAHKLAVSRNIVVSKWAALIGSNAGESLNIQEGQQFFMDLMAMDQEGLLSTEDVLREREKYLGFKGDEPASAGLIENMEEEALQIYFRKAHMDHLIEKAIRGSFKTNLGQPLNRDQTRDFRDGFLEQHGGNYNYTDSERFLNDIISYKAGFERSLVEEARVTNGDMIALAKTTLENQENNDFASPEETAAIAAYVKKGFTVDAIKEGFEDYSSKFPIYDADHSAGFDIGNSTISRLLTLLPGKTLLLTPSDTQASRGGLKDIGVRVFPGSDGSPNIVYAPMVGNGDKDIRGRDAASALLVAFSMIAENNPAVETQISDLANTINRTLDPVLMAQSMIDHYFPDIIAKGDEERIKGVHQSELDKLSEGVDGRGILETLLSVSPSEVDRKSLEIALTDHFMNVSRVARQIGVNAQTAASFSMFDQSRVGFTEDMMLVAEVFTNPKLKEFFDEAFIGAVILNDTSLKDKGLELEIIENIRAISGVVTGKDIQDPEFAEEEEDLDSTEKQGLGLEGNEGSLTKADKEQLDALNLEDKISAPLGLKGINALLRDLALKRGDRHAASELAIDDDYASDHIMFNHMASIFQLAIEDKGEVDVIPQDRPAIDILKGDTRGLETEKEGGIFPLIGSTSRGDSRTYVGEWRNLTQAKAKGSTFLNVAFRHTRIKNINASLLNQTESVQDQIREKALEKIERALDGLGDTKPDEEKIGLPDVIFTPVDVDVELTDDLINQLRKVLPDGALDEAIRDEVEGHKALQKDSIELNGLLLDTESLLADLRSKSRESMGKLFAEQPQTPQVLGAISKDLAAIFSTHSKILTNKSLLKGDAARFFSDQIKNTFAPGSRGRMEVVSVGMALSKIDQLLVFRDSVEAGNESDATLAPFSDVDVAQINEMIEGQIEAYNHHVDVVNGEIDLALEGASNLSGVGFTTKFSKRKLHLKKTDVTAEEISGDNLSRMDDSRRNFSREGVVEAQFSSLISDLIGESFGDEVVQAFSIGGKSNTKLKRADTARFFSEVAKVVEAGANPVEAIESLLEQGLNSDSKVGLFMKDLVGHLALNSKEARTLLEDGARTAADVDAMRNAENQIRSLQNELAQINGELDRLNDGNDTQSNEIGRTYFVGEVPFETKAGDNYNIRRQVGAKIRLVPPVSLVNPFMEEDVQVQAEAIAIARKRNFIQRRDAVKKALNKFATTHVEDAYNAVKRQGDNFAAYDPAKMVGEAVAVTRVEADLIAQRFGEATTEQQKADSRGMSTRALAMLTNPSSPEFKVLSKGDQGRVKVLHMPASFEERAQELGRYMKVGDEPIVLMPTNAKEQLLLAHPNTVSKRNVNSQISDITLAATDFAKAEEVGDSSKAFFFEALELVKGNKFKSKGKFRLTKDLPESLTSEDAAKAFSTEYTLAIQTALNLIRNQNNTGKEKTIDLTGDQAAAQLKQFTFQIEQLVIALDHPAIIANLPARDSILELLDKIETVDPKTFFGFVKTGGGSKTLSNIANFNVDEVFAKAFSTIEGEAISKRLSLGLTVNSSGTNLWMMKYAHHQDARIRNNFRNSFISREAARHLTSFLEHGINNAAGRDGSQTASKLAKEEIGAAAKAVTGGKLSKTDNLNHTLGYVMAMLDGLQDSNGQSLTIAFQMWMKAMKTGFAQNESFHKKQQQMRGNTIMEAAKLGKLSKYWTTNNIDLTRDYELTQEIRSILNKVEAGKTILAETDEQTQEEITQEVINKIKKALEDRVMDGKVEEVKNYAKVINKVFRDIDAAMHLTIAMTAKEPSDATRETISSTPIRLAYAANPASEKQDKEGRFVSDPLDQVKVLDSSFFGGNVTSDHTFQTKDVFRPIAINGISSPLSLIDDSIYRLNVAPTYGIMRKVIGKVTLANNVPTVETEDSGILSIMQEQEPPNNRTKESAVARREYYATMRNARTALASIATEYETVIHNDFQQGVVNTGGAEVMRILGSFYTVRALASVQQLWDQTSGPSFGYSLGKIASGNGKSAALFWKMIGRMISSSTYRKKVREFIKKTSPYVFYRAAEGQDVARDEMRNQRRFGRHKVKSKAGKVIRQLEGSGEWALDKTIASGERILASSVFLVELAQQLETSDIDGILEGRVEFTSKQKSSAKLKVNDMMGQSDQAKKSWFFQSRDENPTANALWRSIVRFSNHTASMSSNTAVTTRMLFSEKPQGVSDSDWSKNREEAVENVVTTLVQNILFYPFKIKTLLPVMLYLIFKAGDDDDDQAARNGQKLANKILVPDEDNNPLAKAAQTILFGKQREAFQLDGNIDEAQASMLAEVMSRSAAELATTIPGYGAIFGYSPIQGLFTKSIGNELSSSLASAVTQTDSEGVYVRSYQPGPVEGIMGLTTPTAVAYDYAEALKLATEYSQTSKFQNNGFIGAYDIAIYLMTEALPFLREARGQIGSELKEEVKKLPKNR